MNRIFGGRGVSGDSKPGASLQFVESQGLPSLDKGKSRHAPHRDLVKVVLRETMRKHGIPSDWIDSRALSVLTRQQQPGMHVQFLVRQADHQLLPYVHAFQESFWEEVLKLDPAARDWLFSVGWEFCGQSVRGFSGMPGLESMGTAGQARQKGDATVPSELADDDDDVATDLQALQALMAAPADPAGVPDGQAGERTPPS